MLCELAGRLAAIASSKDSAARPKALVRLDTLACPGVLLAMKLET
jgi:hypothetical protein